ncbi:HK97 family phage prohead protease [Novosphingobium sp. MBES04]|uniref:HK97 family phage prohead protease n=1 Tax=Novosphingobium sp. MBES04 TaxID=1206458 RepID=UPI000694C8C9|nr:HK97 family phage prohead protease [Novosphingobium sp. MBES04]GAM04818.1 hypothetical conserved protein [Novosphingobium sp. MBES04]
MNVKSLTIEKMDEAGTGRARIAQLSAVDSDGDTYAPGAFSWGQGGGQWCQILPAHNRKAMPLGKAWIYEENDWAVADLHLNLNTQAGKDWHETLKFDLAKGNPVQEWSYGYDVLDADYQQREGRHVQVLKKLGVDEISPVIRGAGVGTGTLSIKSAELKAANFAPLIANLAEMAEAIGEDTSLLSKTGLKQLGEIHVSLGKALEKAATTDPKAEHEIQAALGGWLAWQSRGHLPASD